jgi:quercetin dioxygenase-like cupin family protein
VFFEPGENHWHGAAPSRLMVHVVIQVVDDTGSAGTFGDPVTADQYNAATES